MTGHRFVVAESPTPDTPLSSFMLRNPGCTIDLILEAVVEEEGRRLHQSTVLIKGAAGEGQTWLGRMRIDEKAYAHNAAATATRQWPARYPPRHRQGHCSRRRRQR